MPQRRVGRPVEVTAAPGTAGGCEHCAAAVAAERERIALDLHDDVIQRLFAAGLALSRARSVPQPAVAEVIDRITADLDATVAAIRSIIAGLEPSPPDADFPAEVRAVVADTTRALDLVPSLQLVGGIAGLPAWLRPQVVAVLREALSNVVRHAEASTVDVQVGVDREGVHVWVCDDGRGLAGSTRRSGLHNLTARAVRFGGRLECGERPEGGMSLRWSVPHPDIRPG